MTKAQFDAAVDQLLIQFGGSLTSGRRTAKHTLSVGGFEGDPHTWGLGADVVWDAADSVQRFKIMLVAETFGLKLLNEGTHSHFQPSDFPSGPVHSYGGVTRA